MVMVTPFGTLPSGETVQKVTLQGEGLTAGVIGYGARLQDLRLDGVGYPLVLGAQTLAPYLGPMDYFGATVGRYANRIAGGHFSIGGKTYHADLNDGGRACLHGGRDGAAFHNWALEGAGTDEASFTLVLPAGHMGFPGTFRARTTYRLAGQTLDIEMTASCDMDCPVSLAHHSYFNLDGGSSVRDHLLWINAESYLPVDGDTLPTGEIAPVAGTPFDFQAARRIGRHGYDHNFCLPPTRGRMRPAASLTGTSGLRLSLEADAPGLQVYDAGHLQATGPGGPGGPLTGLDGIPYGTQAGLALETQEWPDAPNHRAFPSPLLPAGRLYRHRMRLSFSA